MVAGNLCVLLLGPVDLRQGDWSLTLGGPKQRAVLAMLTLAGGRVVSMDRLIDGLWGENPPGTAANNVQVHVAALRKLFETVGRRDALVTQAPGYRLELGGTGSDLARFTSLRQEAARSVGVSDLSSASRSFAVALEQWRGQALADLLDEPFAALAATPLDQQRLDTIDAFLDVELRQGRHHDVIGVAEELLRDHPTRENLWAHLMLALYRGGRQAEALAAFQRARDLLDEQLGVDPGPRLRELQGRILRHDPGLAAVARPGRGPAVDLSVCTSTVLRGLVPRRPAQLVTNAGDIVALEAADVTIGRQSDCELRLTDPDVSRHHARVSPSHTGHVVQDLGSTNGTNVNGAPVARHTLSHGDRIEMGSTVLRYEIHGAVRA